MDLAATVDASDKQTIWQFYENVGEPAGWLGRASKASLINYWNFDYEMYAYENQDVAAVYGVDREKVKAIHDWMVKNIKYDKENYDNNTIPGSSYNITGPMLYGTSVCQGYAETFKYFMDVLGIECYVITGNAKNDVGNIGSHAWNEVKLDGIRYYIDVTWDDPVPDVGNRVYWYKYYLVTDPTFGDTHWAD